MDPIERLKAYYNTLTKSEQKVADYILHEPNAILSLTLTNLARQAGVSNAAVIRLSQKIGFNGFSELKFSLNRYLLSRGAGEEKEAKDSTQNILDTYVQYMYQIPSFVPIETLHKVAEQIVSARRLDIWGVNRTAQSARQLSNRLQRLGIYNKMTDDAIVMSDDANLLEQGDVCILFTLAGRGCPTYPQMLADLQRRGCCTVLVTMDPRLKMLQNADIPVILPWISHSTTTNFFEDQIIVYIFIELLLYELVKSYPLLGRKNQEQR